MTYNDPGTRDRQPSDLAAWACSLFALAALCVALYWLFWTSVIWSRFHPHLPWRDLFLVLRDIISLEGQMLSETARDIWLAPHYEAHRILLPRLLMVIDLNWLSGRNHVYYATGGLAIALIWFLHWRAARLHLDSRSAQIFSAALVLCWLCSPAHIWNMLNAINTAWHLTVAFSLLGYYILLAGGSAPGTDRWVFAGTCIILAAFSTFGGVVAALLLPVIAFLFDRRRTLPVLILTVAFCWWYTRGMTSDARLATQWDAGTPELINLIREQARVALENHTPQNILGRTLSFLAWPRAGDNTIWPQLISGGSMVMVLLVWLHVFANCLRRGLAVQPWLMFCLLGASLALGIALATQLGRVLTQPNHAHGPSLERYQTIVVCYWLSWMGMIRALLPEWNNRVQLAYAAGATVLTAYLLLPNGTYLKEEITSASSAATLYARGERMVLNSQAPPPGSRFTPEHVFAFDVYFKPRNLAYHYPLPALDAADRSHDCSALGFGPIYRNGDHLYLHIAKRSASSWLLRDVMLYRERQPVTRLVPEHRGTFTPTALLDPGTYQWQADYPGTLTAGEPYYLAYRQVTGRWVLCMATIATEQP